MARRKGKSGRRIKDWDRRYREGDGVKDAAHQQQRMSRKAVKLRGGSFAQADEDDLAGAPRVEGLVTGLFRGGAVVRARGEELLCGIAKTFRAPEGTTALAVGDEVTVALTRPEHVAGSRETDKDRTDGMVLSRGPRRSALSRPRPWSAKRRDQYQDVPEKVIAANVDVLLIVAAVREPALRRGLIDRFLIIAERGELEPMVVLNKTDLAPPEPAVLADLAELGVAALACSALSGEGLAALTAALAGKRTVLAGASGVGKTTLINAMIPGTDAATRSVREKDQRGRHTTAAATVYDLPGGGMIVDTPGIRELGMSLTAAELPWYFPEFEPYAPACRFNDCTHTHEPHCAVTAAVEAGEIAPRRYESYLRILETLEM